MEPAASPTAAALAKEGAAAIVNHATSSTPAEYYAFLAVCLILGALGLILWFQGRNALKSAKAMRDEYQGDSGNEEPRKRRGTQADRNCETCQDVRVLERVLTTQFQGLEELLNIQLGNFEKRTAAQLEALSKKVDDNQKHGEERMARFESTIAEGFRMVHDRIDRHISQDSAPKVG